MTVAITEAAARRVPAEAPFARWWGFVLEAIGEGTAAVRLPARDEFVRPGGSLQGAAPMALADVAFWIALMTKTGEERTKEDALARRLLDERYMDSGPGKRLSSWARTALPVAIDLSTGPRP